MTTTTLTQTPTRPRRRAAYPIAVGICDHCQGDQVVPISADQHRFYRASGITPVPTTMPCPTCRTANGSTGVRRLSDIRANPYIEVPDTIPPHWSETGNSLDQAAPIAVTPPKTSAEWIAEIKAGITARIAQQRALR